MAMQSAHGIFVAEQRIETARREAMKIVDRACDIYDTMLATKAEPFWELDALVQEISKNFLSTFADLVDTFDGGGSRQINPLSEAVTEDEVDRRVQLYARSQEIHRRATEKLAALRAQSESS